MKYCSRGISYGLARCNDGPGRCSRGRPLRIYYQFHVKQNNYIYPRTIFIKCMYRLQYSSLCKIKCIDTIDWSGDFDMPLSNPLFLHSTWAGISSLFTHKFLYYTHILKSWNMLLHMKLNNSRSTVQVSPSSF